MLYVLSVRQKVPKNSALGKNLPSAKLGCARCKTQASLVFTRWHKLLQAPFAHAAKGEPSVGHLLATPGFRLFSGCCGTCFVRLYKKIYTRTKLQTVLTQWPENSRPCVGFFNGAVSLSATDFLLARIAYSKTTAAPHNFSSA